MSEYQEELFRAKVQEFMVCLGIINDDAQWSNLELYAAMQMCLDDDDRFKSVA